jgi:dissimilatory sulfite reductase (desulfoviridin) alpha/beta subunit
MQMVTDVARKYGDGRVALTVRLTIEVQGIPYENLEPLVAEVEAAGLVTGGTGSIVRPVVACKGTVCVHGLFDTQAFAKRIYDEFFVGWHNVTLPHKFKIAVGGCPNNCVKPGLNDFGVYGQSVPEQDLDKCRSCVKCGVIERCPVHCVSRGPAGKIVVDKEKCTNCGKCIKACPMHSFSEKERGYAVVIGGIWGKTQRLGNNIGGVYSEDEVMKLIEKAILLYRELGKTGERFGRTVERVGVDEFIRQLKSDDVLSRKDEILAVAAKAKGGASC